jgi:hypothetical protein
MGIFGLHPHRTCDTLIERISHKELVMKTVKSFTLSPEVQKYIKDQSREMDRSQSSALDRLLRELAALKGHKLTSAEKAS